MISKNKIVESIYTSKLINEVINNVVDREYRDDFKSHFILEIYNVTDEKLNKLIMKDQLDWFCLKVITNQWKSTSSSFWKIYRNNGFAGSNLLLYYNEVRDLIDDEYVEPIDVILVKSKINELLSTQYKDFMVNQYHKKLFEMYYYDKLSYRKIEKITLIHYRTICNSINKTKKYIKDRWV